MVWKKGYEYAIQAMKALKDKGIDFEYRIIGNGDNIQPIQFLINELHLDNEIKLLGELNHDKIIDELNRADVFVHPAISEGFSNAVLEAQAMGVPVICTDADGLPENVEHNITGFVVPKWDAGAIAEKILWCFENKEAAANMGHKGIERVSKLFDVNKQIEDFLSFYDKVISDDN